MFNKGSLIVVGILVLVVGIIAYSSLLESAELDAPTQEDTNLEETVSTDREPFFVYGEILAIDGREITLDQHIDSGSVDIQGQVTLAEDVQVYANHADGEAPADRADLRPGHIVGMNVGTDGRVETVTYDAFDDVSEPVVPSQGDLFVYFEITGLNLDERLIHIEQHMDSGSVEVDETLRLAGDVKVLLATEKREIEGSLDDLAIGQSGGLILQSEGNLKGLVDTIIVDAYAIDAAEIVPADPRIGEIFIYAEILEIDGHTLYIDQHMDSGSVDVQGQVEVRSDATLRAAADPSKPISFDDLGPGDVVGMIQDANGLIRAIMVD